MDQVFPHQRTDSDDPKASRVAVAVVSYGKRFAETLFYDYHRQFGVPVKIARVLIIYGPRMLPEDGRVVATFIV